MATATRFYVVSNPVDKSTRLIEASSASSAKRHCMSHLVATAATPSDVARLMGSGVKPENAAAAGDHDSDA